VERAYKDNGETPVVILTHSMGSLAGLFWLNSRVTQSWKDQHIRALVSLAGPWAGTVRSMKVFAVGK
jgi:lysophospholipase-3